MAATASSSSGGWRPRAWAYAAFVACLILLALAAASNDPSARAGAAAGYLGIAAGAVFAAMGARADLADDERMVPLARAVLLVVGRAGPIWLGLAVALTAVVGWDRLDRGGGALLAGAGSLGIVAAVGYAGRTASRTEGVDREVLLRSASFSFFVVVLGAGSYALFEVLAGAPRLSMWVVWTCGMLTWAVTSMIVKSRMV